MVSPNGVYFRAGNHVQEVEISSTIKAYENDIGSSMFGMADEWLL